jgi:hypothetical protein
MGEVRREKKKGVARNYLVKFRVTLAEREAIKELAEKKGLTVTRLLLQAIGMDRE